MFDWGFWEFLVVGIVAMLVFGPERLPEVARNVGLWVGKARRYVANVRADFESEFNTGELRDLLGQQQEQIRELKGMVETAKGEFDTSMSEVSEELQDATSSLNKQIQEPLSAKSDDELFAENDADEMRPLAGAESPEVDADTPAVKPATESKPSPHE